MDPVQDDEDHAADHDHEAQQQEGSGPDLLHRLHGLLLDQFDVESRGQDEDEHGSSRSADDAKNVPDAGDKDDQGVGAGQQGYSDDGVADPAELLRGAQELVYRGTNREKHHGDGESDGSQHCQADDQQQHIILVDLGVGVQQLRLHVHCVETQETL